MSFFVSKSLQGRVTEENLIDQNPGISTAPETVYVSASFESFDHDFNFVSYQNHPSFCKLCLEVPQTYKYLARLLQPDTCFKVAAPDGNLDSFRLGTGTYELVKQNERSCYLLKIVITAQLEDFKK